MSSLVCPFSGLSFVVPRPYPQGGGIVLVAFPVGGKVAAHFLDEPFQPVGVLCLQLVVFGLRQKNILVSAIGRGRLPTHSLCLALCKVVYSSLVRGRFSDHHKVGFLTISRTVFRLYEGRISGHQLVGKLYLWHSRHFDIKPVRCGEAAPFPFQQPRHVQFIKRPLYGGAALIQYFGYLRDWIDNIYPALVVLPLVLLGECGTV